LSGFSGDSPRRTTGRGGVAIADGERLDGDESLKTLLGVEKIPDLSALGE